MSRDRDFDAYVAARWAGLVRVLVLMGSPKPLAEEAARTALARCRASWGRVRRADDVDVHVHRELLACRRARLRGRWWEEDPLDPVGAAATEGTAEPAADEPAGDEPDAARLLRALESALDHLTTAQRLVLVLRFVAGLDEQQVADVTDLDAGTVADLVGSGLSALDRDGRDLAALREVGR